MKKSLKLITAVVLLFSLLLLLPTGCFDIEKVSGNGVLDLYGADPHTLDPAISSDATSHQYLAQIFSGLVYLDENLEPAADIARDWRVSSDGKTYTFFLREDVVFHDGTPVTAGDFKYSWERACLPETWQLLTDHVTASVYLNDIAGVDEVIAGKSREISGVKVIDDYTLEVTLDEPRSYFLHKMTYPTAYIVNRKNAESGDDWWHQPVGTGPFKLKQWDELSELVLERNDLYYGEKARLSSVVFHIRAGIPIDLYESGEIDVAAFSSDYYWKATDTDGDFHDQLVVSPELSFSYIGFNTAEPPFDDVNIRRAFAMAVDKEKLVSLLFNNMAKPADGILPPGMPGYNEALSGLEYDIAGARELIKESGYGGTSGLPTVTVTSSGWGGLVYGSLEAIVYDWRENLGADVKVRLLEPEVFFYHLKEEQDELYDMGWIADYPHPQDFLEVLFQSEAGYNYGGYGNAEFDALLEKAGSETDAEKSYELYRQAEQILVEDAACIPLWFGENYYLVKPYVKGYKLNALGIAMLNKVYLERN
ncbi:peptide ABC transporter substrate-binding protein [Chloroflexota bacterium]